MNLKKAEKAIDTLEDNAKKMSKISESVSDFKFFLLITLLCNVFYLLIVIYK